MSGHIGRKVAFTWAGSPVLGIREKNITINGEPVEYTSDEDGGVPVLDSEVSELGWEIAISGVTKDKVFMTAAAAKTGRIQAVTLTYPDGSTVAGTFYLGNFSQGNPYKDAATFDATLRSSGAVVYTPAP